MQTIQVGFVISIKEKISFGVSQGSGLEPLIFLIYINDIYCSADKFNFYSHVKRAFPLFRRVCTRLFCRVNLWIACQLWTIWNPSKLCGFAMNPSHLQKVITKFSELFKTVKTLSSVIMEKTKKIQSHCYKVLISSIMVAQIQLKTRFIHFARKKYISSCQWILHFLKQILKMSAIPLAVPGFLSLRMTQQRL